MAKHKPVRGRKPDKRKNPRKADVKPTGGNPDPRRAKPAGGQPDPRRGKPAGGQPDPRRAKPAGGQPDPRGGKPAGGQPDSRRSKPKTHRAMKRAMDRKSEGSRRRRNRGGNYILYYLLAAVVILIVFVILANTILFNCAAIEADGSVRYSEQQIVDSSRIKLGDSLLHIDTKKAESAIVSTLPYIDMAEVKKVFPTKIKISVTEAKKWFYVEGDGVTAAISRGGKIIETSSPDGMTLVKGYEPANLEPGGRLYSAVEAKADIPAQVLSAAEEAGLVSLTEIDITDRFSITAVYDDRITLKLGDSADLDSKFHVAAALIRDELSPSESVTIILTDPEKAAVHNNNSAVEIPVIPVQETAEASSETRQAE